MSEGMFDFPGEPGSGELLQVEKEALLAGINLVGRTGAKDIEFGYLDDDVADWRDARWWAKAQYQGRRVDVENQRGPAQAVELLAKTLCEGGTCVHCGRETTIGRTVSQRKCAYVRIGDTYKRGCAR